MPKVGDPKPYHLRKIISELVEKRWGTWKRYCERRGLDPFDLAVVREFLNKSVDTKKTA